MQLRFPFSNRRFRTTVSFGLMTSLREANMTAEYPACRYKILVSVSNQQFYFGTYVAIESMSMLVPTLNYHAEKLPKRKYLVDDDYITMI